MALFIICCLILLLQCNLIEALLFQGRFDLVTKYIYSFAQFLLTLDDDIETKPRQDIPVF